MTRVTTNYYHVEIVFDRTKCMKIDKLQNVNPSFTKVNEEISMIHDLHGCTVHQ